MCGIIYAKNLTGNEPVNNLIKVIYQNQKDRGQLGFGFVGMNSKSIDTCRAVNEKEIIRYLNEKGYSEILFHHRNPTSTRNTLKSTHPFIIHLNRKSYYFVHNGIVQNDAELQREHYKRNIAYESYENGLFNDSEALAWDFCLWLNGEQIQMRAEGAVAFVCLEIDEDDHPAKLYFYRNAEAPLRVYADKTLLVLSSEGNYPLVKENRLYYWDYQSGQVLKAGELKIACVYDAYIDNGLDYEVMLRDELRALEQERDYLVSVGNYDDAEFIEEEIADLTHQLKGRSLTPFR
jgi:predicted glutamine amidotransferase